MTGFCDKFVRDLAVRGDFLVDVHFDSARRGPKIVQVDGQAYFRFMDYIYLPKQPDELSPEQVVALCDLRMELFEKIVDKALNRRVVYCMVGGVQRILGPRFNKQLRVLDFGCGTDFSSSLVKERWNACEIVGVDISRNALNCARENGLSCQAIDLGEPFPFHDGTFDTVIAVFVMHFKTSLEGLPEIHRVLKTEGLFTFNLYNKEPNGLSQSLTSVGFTPPSPAKECKLPGTHRVLSVIKSQL